MQKTYEDIWCLYSIIFKVLHICKRLNQYKGRGNRNTTLEPRINNKDFYCKLGFSRCET